MIVRLLVRTVVEKMWSPRTTSSWGFSSFGGKRSGALMSRKKSHNNSSGATLGFEETLWQAADKMRGHMDPSEYKHVALGGLFNMPVCGVRGDR